MTGNRAGRRVAAVTLCNLVSGGLERECYWCVGSGEGALRGFSLVSGGPGWGIGSRVGVRVSPDLCISLSRFHLVLLPCGGLKGVLDYSAVSSVDPRTEKTVGGRSLWLPLAKGLGDRCGAGRHG